MRTIFLTVLAALLFFGNCSYATTLVYNLRIRRTFEGLATLVKLNKKKISWAFSSVPVLYRRDGQFQSEVRNSNVFEKRHGGGSIFNLRHVPSSTWWCEITTALQKESVCAEGTASFKASRTGLDDIVIAAGRNWFPSDRTQYTLYGLAGFPTQRQVTLEEAQDRLVGTRFYALGGGGEVSYSFRKSPAELLAGIAQIRVIHFFKRPFAPILPIGSIIRPGQGTDLLLSIRYRRRFTVLETGYNPTFFTNQAIEQPDRTFTTNTQVRHGTYLNVLHVITRPEQDKVPVVVGGGILFNELRALDLTTVLLYGTLTFLF